MTKNFVRTFSLVLALVLFASFSMPAYSQNSASDSGFSVEQKKEIKQIVIDTIREMRRTNATRSTARARVGNSTVTVELKRQGDQITALKQDVDGIKADLQVVKNILEEKPWEKSASSKSSSDESQNSDTVKYSSVGRFIRDAWRYFLFPIVVIGGIVAIIMLLLRQRQNGDEHFRNRRRRRVVHVEDCDDEDDDYRVRNRRNQQGRNLPGMNIPVVHDQEDEGLSIHIRGHVRYGADAAAEAARRIMAGGGISGAGNNQNNTQNNTQNNNPPPVLQPTITGLFAVLDRDASTGHITSFAVRGTNLGAPITGVLVNSVPANVDLSRSTDTVLAINPQTPLAPGTYPVRVLKVGPGITPADGTVNLT